MSANDTASVGPEGQAAKKRLLYRSIAVVVAFFVLQYLCGLVPPYTRFEPDSAVAGESQGGLEAQLGVKELAERGDLVVEAQVRNVGEEALRVPRMPEGTPPGDAEYFEVEQDGRILDGRPRARRGPRELSAADVAELAAKESLRGSFQITLRDWFENNAYGGTLRFVFRNDMEDAGPGMKLWTGEVRSGDVYVWHGHPWPVELIRALLWVLLVVFIIWSLHRAKAGQPAQE